MHVSLLITSVSGSYLGTLPSIGSLIPVTEAGLMPFSLCPLPESDILGCHLPSCAICTNRRCATM